jgi:hypothetical protein
MARAAAGKIQRFCRPRFLRLNQWRVVAPITEIALSKIQFHL